MTTLYEHSLNDLAEFQPKVKLPKNKNVPFINMEQINPQNRYVTNIIEKKHSGSSSKFKNNDILFARITPSLENRKIAQAKITASGFGSTEFFVIRARKEKTDQNFLYYLVKSDYIVENAVNSYVGASGRQRADLGFVKRIIVKVPKVPTQQKIAAILTAYDDLIENNNKRISILENTAEQIYKEWFVRMRFPNYKYTKFIKGIYQGWEIKPLVKEINLVMGQSPKSEFYNIEGKGLPFSQGVGNYGRRFPNQDIYCSVKKRMANEGDILFSVRAPVGRLNIAETKMIIGRGLAAMRHKQGYQSFLYYLLKNYFESEDVIGNGAIFNSVGKDELSKFKILVPSENYVKRFEEIVKPIDDEIKILFKSTSYLKNTRDLLLNRLLAGQINVENLDIKFPPSMENDNA